jgi:putative membrane protein
MAGALLSRGSRGLRSAVLGLVFSLLACADGTDRERSPEGVDGSMQVDAGLVDVAGPIPALCSDGEIAATARSVSEGEVALAQALREKFRDGNAVALADNMLTEHSLLLEQLNGETRAAQITPVGCGLERAVSAAAGAESAALQTLTSPALERAYVEREILSHLQSMALIDRVLYPGARNERIRFAVRAMRDNEAQHQAAALDAQRALEGVCAN